jgi:hypothetical protein
MGQEIRMDAIRELYLAAGKDYSLAEKLYAAIPEKLAAKDPVMRAYRGSARAMMAEKAFFPTTKLKYFTEGKAEIEESIRQAPIHVEIRFLRLMLQSSIPAFLGYDNLATDKEFLLRSFKSLNKPGVPLFTIQMLKILIISPVFSETEKNELRRVQQIIDSK